MQETNREPAYTEAPHEGRTPQRSDRIGQPCESEPAGACIKFLESTNSSLFRNTAKMKDERSSAVASNDQSLRESQIITPLPEKVNSHFWSSETFTKRITGINVGCYHTLSPNISTRGRNS